jgi:hypothetical protein
MNDVRIIEHRWGDRIDRNAQYRLIREVSCYKVVGTKPTNSYYGASQIYTQDTRPVTLIRGTEIQFLCGGDFALLCSRCHQNRAEHPLYAELDGHEYAEARVEIMSLPPDAPFSYGSSYGGDRREEREHVWLKLLAGKVVQIPVSI